MAMPEEPTPRIRPIWLIGGSALLVVLGGCALLSVAAAALLIWFSSGISSHTATVTPKAAVQNPTPVITAAAPTPLPGFNTASPFVTATSATVFRPPPDQAVRNYYQLVSQQRYDLSWPLLTDSLQAEIQLLRAQLRLHRLCQLVEQRQLCRFRQRQHRFSGCAIAPSFMPNSTSS